MDLRFEKVESGQTVEMRKQFLASVLAPLDGMWESFVSMGQHHLVVNADEPIGYFVTNSTNRLIQFYVQPPQVAREAFRFMIKQAGIIEATIPTCDPQTLSLCLDEQQESCVSTLMYHLPVDSISHEAGPTLDVEPAEIIPGKIFRLVPMDDLPTAVDFASDALGGNREWLEGYFAERVACRELFGLWKDDKLIATGECRPSALQVPYTDLGVLVGESYRNQGVATAILERLVLDSLRRKLKPICSTERTNVASQRAIEKSGFVSQHRLVEFQFSPQ